MQRTPLAQTMETPARAAERLFLGLGFTLLLATACHCLPMFNGAGTLRLRLMERALCGYVWRLHHLLTATIYAQSFHSQPVTVYTTRHGTRKCNLFVVLTFRCQSF